MPNKVTLALCALATCSTLNAQRTSEIHSEKTITRIAFGSCNNPRDKAKPVFDAILEKQADLDNNGQSDLLDWAFSGYPNMNIIGNDLTISFEQNLDANPLTSQIEQSTDLITWTTANTELLSQSYNNDGTATYTYKSLTPISGIRQFLRLQVTVP